jgi:hypothetical protein
LNIANRDSLSKIPGFWVIPKKYIVIPKKYFFPPLPAPSLLQAATRISLANLAENPWKHCKQAAYKEQVAMYS